MTSPSHPATLSHETLLRGCDVRRGRAGGPGGQNRNKVSTAVDLLHEATGVAGSASERRSQAENLGVAVFRLRVNLALAVRSPYEPGTPPSELWRSRLRGGRIALNPSHDDFPSMLAEALDVIAALQFDLAKAGAVLACTPSQLVKLLKDEPRALPMVNAQREARGLRVMK